MFDCEGEVRRSQSAACFSIGLSKNPYYLQNSVIIPFSDLHIEMMQLLHNVGCRKVNPYAMMAKVVTDIVLWDRMQLQGGCIDAGL